MNIKIKIEKTKNLTATDLANLINTKVGGSSDFSTVLSNKIFFQPNSNCNRHTFLIGLLILLAKRHYEQYSFYVSLENIGGSLCSLTSENIPIIYDFVESINFDDINISID